MGRSAIVEKLLHNMDNMYELGRQQAFELGNPFYYQLEDNKDLWCKELPTGEIYLVKIKVCNDENNLPLIINDTIIRRLK